METILDIDYLDPTQAEVCVQELLASNPSRLRHTLVVADRARQVARDINDLRTGHVDEGLVYCAGLLHDLGYAAPIHRTGFHPLDTANFLRERGFQRLADVILPHSTAPEEAKIKGITGVPEPGSLEAKILTYADMHVGPNGQEVSLEQRISEIIKRYGTESPVGKATLAARPRLCALVQEVHTLLGIQSR